MLNGMILSVCRPYVVKLGAFVLRFIMMSGVRLLVILLIVMAPHGTIHNLEFKTLNKVA